MCALYQCVKRQHHCAICRHHSKHSHGYYHSQYRPQYTIHTPPCQLDDDNNRATRSHYAQYFSYHFARNHRLAASAKSKRNKRLHYSSTCLSYQLLKTLLILLFTVDSQYIFTMCKSNQRYAIHFQQNAKSKDINNRWLSFLNLRIRFQSPDVVDVMSDDERDSSQDVDFDEPTSEKDEEKMIVFIVTPPPLLVEKTHRKSQISATSQISSSNPSTYPIVENYSPTFDYFPIGGTTARVEQTTVRGRTTLYENVELISKEDVEYKENDNLPIDVKAIFSYVPHKLRPHKTKLKPTISVTKSNDALGDSSSRSYNNNNNNFDSNNNRDNIIENELLSSNKSLSEMKINALEASTYASTSSTNTRDDNDEATSRKLLKNVEDMFIGTRYVNADDEDYAAGINTSDDDASTMSDSGVSDSTTSDLLSSFDDSSLSIAYTATTPITPIIFEGKASEDSNLAIEAVGFEVEAQKAISMSKMSQTTTPYNNLASHSSAEVDESLNESTSSATSTTESDAMLMESCEKNITFSSNCTSDEDLMDEEEITEEEFVLIANEIFHNDSLHRSEETLRELLSNTTLLEQSNNFGSMHRDYGGSFLLPLLKSINYNNNSVPIVFSDIPVHVKVSLDIIHLTNFDSKNMDYTVDLEMNMRWYDVRLANKFTRPVRIREAYIIDQIWKPDPYFNSKFSYFHTVSFPNFRMRVMPDGMVQYTLRVTLLPSCLMTFCRHPHDSQKCDLIISSVAYTSSVVNFVWEDVEPVRFSTKVSLPELRNKGIRTDTCAVEGKLIASSCLRLTFFMERDGARYIVEKYIPSTLAMMFAWVASYVPYNYEDVRIITPITVLLTLVQMEKGDLEVRTSYLTSMDYWFGAMKTFSVISLIESLIVLALIKRGRAMERQAQRAPNEYMRELYQGERRRITALYHRLDAASRFLSPVIFVAFFIYYVLRIAQGDERACLPKSIY